MRSFIKKIRFLLFPLLALSLMSFISLYSIGYIKIGAKKNEPTVFEQVEDMKRSVASLNSKLTEISSFDSSEDSEQNKSSPIQKAGLVRGEMHVELGSSMRSLIQTECSFQTLEKSVASSQIKFDFIGCEHSGKQMKLINKTNGYEAQIFGIRGNKVSSDFIQLEQGTNELLLEISSTPGQIKSQVIKIKRIQ